MHRQRTWSPFATFFHHARRLSSVDLLIVVGLAGLIVGIADLANEWTTPIRPTVEIDLDDPWVLPRLTFFSMMRGLVAYVFALGFTLVYGYWAAKDKAAERVLVPLLDILQSIPVLSFLPGIVLALVALFPSSNIGLELAAVLMIFTGQVWNMTFSYYHSLRSVPHDLREVAAINRLTAWQTWKWLELPYSTMGLVWNSMMSMAGGWFFLMINESFRLGDRDFRLPGLGSYMSVAVEQDRGDCMILAIVAMIAMIVALDQFLWRPVVVWAQRFRIEEGGQQAAASSWFLNWLRRSRLVRFIGHWLRRGSRIAATDVPVHSHQQRLASTPRKTAWLSMVAFAALLILLAFGAWKLVLLLRAVTLDEWGSTFGAASLTLGRVLVSTAIGTLWAVPAGLAIGLSPRLSRLLQPVVQVLASFPAPMLFPIVIAVLTWSGVPLGWGSIMLMLLGTQWYILFNVLAGAMAIPSDLREAARSFRVPLWQRFWTLYLPAVFPYLVTGWVTAAGGAWNASIVAEYVTFRGEVVQTEGLGARISNATAEANFPVLAASTLVMAVLVVTFNRTVWRWCYRIAETKYSLNK